MKAQAEAKRRQKQEGGCCDDAGERRNGRAMLRESTQQQDQEPAPAPNHARAQSIRSDACTLRTCVGLRVLRLLAWFRPIDRSIELSQSLLEREAVKATD